MPLLLKPEDLYHFDCLLLWHFAWSTYPKTGRAAIIEIWLIATTTLCESE